VIVFERLLTSWLFWLAMLAIAVTLAINEAFFARHVPEAKPPSDPPVTSGAADKHLGMTMTRAITPRSSAAGS
jgi:hypothetical protein